MAKVEKIKTDVLIIGAGGAGLRAAIEAHKNKVSVLILTKEEMGGAHTSMAMGGINVAIKSPATPKLHYEDTVNGGWDINNHKMAKIFAYEMPDRIHDLEDYGVKFDRLPDGSYYTWAGGKQTAPLNLSAGDYTGREMMQGLVSEIKKKEIPYLEDYFVTKIFKKGNVVIGAFAIDLKSKKEVVIEAKSTIIATGGAGMLYLINTNAKSNTGEGYAWALNLGVQLVDMEMIQFHPTGMGYPPKVKGTLVTEKVRGHGGILKNRDGERFMIRYQPKRLELAGRDEVTRAIYQEVLEGRGNEHGNVYLDIRHWKKGDVERLIPDVFENHMNVGIDIRKEMMEISPSMHHVMGGININEWGKTNIKGLYGVGEVTRNIHGANRLGGNSIAEGQVFGRRVGIQSSKDAKKAKQLGISQSLIDAQAEKIESLLKRKSGVNPETLINKLKKLMWEKVGIIRNEKYLLKAQEEIEVLKKDSAKVFAKNRRELQECLELYEMLDTASVIVASAIVRKESRGAHFRSDFPKTDPKWRKNVMVYKDSRGKLITKTIPVV